MEKRHSRMSLRRGAGVLSLLLIDLLAGEVQAQSTKSLLVITQPAGTFRLTVSEGTLSLEAQEASVLAIFAEIQRQTGIAIENHLEAEKTITIHLDHMPLEHALKRLGGNTAIFYTTDPDTRTQRITKVIISPAGQAGAPPVGASSGQQKAKAENESARSPQPFQFEFDPSLYEEQPK